MPQEDLSSASGPDLDESVQAAHRLDNPDHSPRRPNRRSIARAKAANRRVMAARVKVDQVQAENEALGHKLQLAHEASMADDLTGLPNRRALKVFYEALQTRKESLRRATDPDRPHARTHLVAITDLDGFKFTNDTYGHAVGNKILMEAADRMAGDLREGDFVGRYGGDENMLLLPNTSAEDGLKIVSRLNEVVSQPYEIEGQTYHVGISAGLAELDPRVDFDSMYRQADDALREAKENGKGRVVVFEPMPPQDMTG